MRGDVLVQELPESAITLSELAGRIPGNVVFTGEAALLYRAAIRKLFGERALFAPLSAMVPSAASVAEIGMAMIKNGGQADADSLTPLYIRRPEAEVAWEKKSEVAVDFMKKEDLDRVLAIEQASFSMPWSRNLFLAELRNRAVSTSLVSLAGDPADTW